MKLHWGLAGAEAAGMPQFNQSAAAITAAPAERRDRTGLCFMIGPICILACFDRRPFRFHDSNIRLVTRVLVSKLTFDQSRGVTSAVFVGSSADPE